MKISKIRKEQNGRYSCLKKLEGGQIKQSDFSEANQPMTGERRLNSLEELMLRKERQI